MIYKTEYGEVGQFCGRMCKEGLESDREHGVMHPAVHIEGVDIKDVEPASLITGRCAYCGTMVVTTGDAVGAITVAVFGDQEPTDLDPGHPVHAAYIALREKLQRGSIAKMDEEFPGWSDKWPDHLEAEGKPISVDEVANLTDKELAEVKEFVLRHSVVVNERMTDAGPIESGTVYDIDYRCETPGPAVESGRVRGRWNGKHSPNGQLVILPSDGTKPVMYLFPKEIESLVPAG